MKITIQTDRLANMSYIKLSDSDKPSFRQIDILDLSLVVDVSEDNEILGVEFFDAITSAEIVFIDDEETRNEKEKPDR
jgi:uncharacterized protein YuzE